MKTSPRVAHAHYAGIPRLSELRVWLMIPNSVAHGTDSVAHGADGKAYGAAGKGAETSSPTNVTDCARATLVHPLRMASTREATCLCVSLRCLRETIKTLKVAFPFGQRTSFRASERDVSALTITPRAQPKLNNEVVNLQSSTVVLDKALHRALHDGAQLHAKAFGCLLHLAVEGVGYGAYEVDA